MLIYTINRKKVIKPVLDSSWFYLKALIVFIIFVFLIKDESTYLVVFCIFFGFPFLIQIIHHLNYYYHDRNAILTVDHTNRRIGYSNKGIEITFNYEDIKSITRFQGCIYPKPLEPRLLPHHFYHHTTIESKSGESITFSDFVCSEIGVFHPNKYLKVRVFMNLIGSKKRRHRALPD